MLCLRCPCRGKGQCKQKHLGSTEVRQSLSFWAWLLRFCNCALFLPRTHVIQSQLQGCPTCLVALSLIRSRLILPRLAKTGDSPGLRAQGLSCARSSWLAMTAPCCKATRALVCSFGGVALGTGLQHALRSTTVGDCTQFREKNHREDYRDPFDAQVLPSGGADHHLPARHFSDVVGWQYVCRPASCSVVVTRPLDARWFFLEESRALVFCGYVFCIYSLFTVSLSYVSKSRHNCHIHALCFSRWRCFLHILQ